jgi:hypothetical protein
VLGWRDGQGPAVGIRRPTCDSASWFEQRQDVSCRRLAGFSILIILCALLTGCGRQPAIVRLPVRGVISLANGEKLGGSITFIPVAGHAPSATTSVRDGSYQFDATNGPTAGPHRVVINRVVSKSDLLKSIGHRNSKSPPEPSPTVEPKKEWTRRVDVTEQNSQECNFTLEP